MDTERDIRRAERRDERRQARLQARNADRAEKRRGAVDARHETPVALEATELPAALAESPRADSAPDAISVDAGEGSSQSIAATPGELPAPPDAEHAAAKAPPPAPRASVLGGRGPGRRDAARPRRRSASSLRLPSGERLTSVAVGAGVVLAAALIGLAVILLS